MEQLINLFVDCYYKYEFKEGEPLSEAVVKNTITVLVSKNCYRWIEDSKGIRGYVEFWRVTEAQLERIMRQEPFDVGLEDINSGPICYVSNLVIRPDAERSGIINHLIFELYQANHDAERFVWHQRKSKHMPVRVYSNRDLRVFNERHNKAEVI